METTTLILICITFAINVGAANRVIKLARENLLFQTSNFLIVLNAISMTVSPLAYNYDFLAFLHENIIPFGILSLYLPVINGEILTILAYNLAIYVYKQDKTLRQVLIANFVTFIAHILIIRYLYHNMDFAQVQLINHLLLCIFALVFGGIAYKLNLIQMRPIQNDAADTRQFWSLISYFCAVIATNCFVLDALWQLAQGAPYHRYTPLIYVASLCYIVAAISVLMSSYVSLIYLSRLPLNFYYYLRLKRLKEIGLALSNRELVYSYSEKNLWSLIKNINLELYRHTIILSDIISVLPESKLKTELSEIYSQKQAFEHTVYLLSKVNPS